MAKPFPSHRVLILLSYFTSRQNICLSPRRLLHVCAVCDCAVCDCACTRGGLALIKVRSSSLDLPSPRVRETAACTRARLFDRPPAAPRLSISRLVGEQQQQQQKQLLSPRHTGAPQTRSLHFGMDSSPSLSLHLYH